MIKMKYIYNKLVRDKIPENIDSMKGRKCKYKILNDKEYLQELDKKYLRKLMNLQKNILLKNQQI